MAPPRSEHNQGNILGAAWCSPCKSQLKIISKVPNNFQMQYTKYQAILSDLYNETIILDRITYKEMLYSKCDLIEK